MTPSNSPKGQPEQSPRPDYNRPPRSSHSSSRPPRRKKKKTLLLPMTNSLRDRTQLSLDDATYIVFDIETTGGNPENNGITEVFALKVQAGKVLDQFYTMVNPRVRIPPIVRKMTGITNQMVRDAPYIETVMPGFVSFIGDDLMVSHNTIGDMRFLRHYSAMACGRPVGNLYICTHLLTEKLIPEAPEKSLKGLAKYFAFDLGDVHRAEDDAYLTWSLFKELQSRLAGKGLKTVEEAIRLQGDYESSLRLGWQVEDVPDLPAEPGVLHFYDDKDRSVFFTSCLNLKHELQALQKLPDLPKPLLRQILKATRIDYETTPSHFSALMSEAEWGERLNPVVYPRDWHGNEVTVLHLGIKADAADLRIGGSLQPGVAHAFGPLVDHKKSYQDIKSLQECLLLDEKKAEPALQESTAPQAKRAEGDAASRSKSAKKGQLQFALEFTEPVLAWLKQEQGEAASFYRAQSRAIRNWFRPRVRKRMHEYEALLQALKEADCSGLQAPELLNFVGLAFVKRAKEDAIDVYTILHALPIWWQTMPAKAVNAGLFAKHGREASMSEQDIKSFWQSAQKELERIRELYTSRLTKIAQDKSSAQDGPSGALPLSTTFSKAELQKVSAFIWWQKYAVKRSKGRIMNQQDIAAKLSWLEQNR